MAQEPHFYHELDTKTKRSFCTCQTLAIATVLLAILFSIGAAVVVKKVSQVVLPHRKVIATADDANQLQDKLLDLKKTTGASTSLTITEVELTSLLVTNIGKQPAIPIRNIQAEINPDEVVISGTATSFLNSTVQLSVVPKVVDGSVHLELVKIKAGSLPVPALVTEQLAKGFDKLIADGLNETEGITVKSVRLEQGKMIITGVVK